jgi:hypothetical protein
VRIGITGHQRLNDTTAWQWVAGAIRSELSIVSSPLVGITSLAIGADQLLARLVLERGGKIHAILPYQDIERSFLLEDLPAFRQLVDQAEIEVLDTPGTDQDAYLAAGLRVADLSDLLIAVWDGQPADGKGGTADVVAYAERKGVPLVYINPMTRSVQHTKAAPSSIDR